MNDPPSMPANRALPYAGEKPHFAPRTYHGDRDERRERDAHAPHPVPVRYFDGGAVDPGANS